MACSKHAQKRDGWVDDAELSLLMDVAAAKKTFEQVRCDAETFRGASRALKNLITTNAARGVTQRLAEVTGISKESLSFHTVRGKDGLVNHPFVQLSTTIVNSLANDSAAFNVTHEQLAPGVAASSFIASPDIALTI